MRKRWKYRVANWFLCVYTQWFGRLSSRDSFQPTENFQNIAVFSTTALGDFLMNTPAIKAIRRRYPDANIIFVSSLVNKSFVEQGYAWYDRVIYWNNKLTTLGPLVRSLKQEGQIDLAVILHSHPPYDLLAAVFAGARYVFRDNLMQMNAVPEFNRWLTNYPVLFYGHHIQRRLELVSLLGAPIDDERINLPFVVSKSSALNNNHDYRIGLQFGASKQAKCWPIDYYADVANSLLTKYENIKLIPIGTKAELGLYTTFMSLLHENVKNRIESYVGQTTLTELVQVIVDMDLLLTGDTGPQHIAIAVKTRTLTLFINTDPREAGRYQDEDLHIMMQPRCHILDIERQPFGIRGVIQPNLVIEKIEQVLSLQQSEDKTA